MLAGFSRRLFGGSWVSFGGCSEARLEGCSWGGGGGVFRGVSSAVWGKGCVLRSGIVVREACLIGFLWRS